MGIPLYLFPRVVSGKRGCLESKRDTRLQHAGMGMGLRGCRTTYFYAPRPLFASKTSCFGRKFTPEFFCRGRNRRR